MKYNEFWNLSQNATNFLVFNNYGGITPPPGSQALDCSNPGQVCAVYGTIGEAWYANAAPSNHPNPTLAAPRADEVAYENGRSQGFVTSDGRDAWATWNPANNAVCAYVFDPNNQDLFFMWAYPSYYGPSDCLLIIEDL